MEPLTVHDGAHGDCEVTSAWPFWLMALGRELADSRSSGQVVALSLPTSEFASVFFLLGVVTANPEMLPNVDAHWAQLKAQRDPTLVRYQTSSKYWAGTLKVAQDDQHGLVPHIGGTRFALPRPRILTVQSIEEWERDLYPMSVPEEIGFLEALMPGVDTTRYVCDTSWCVVHMGNMSKLEECARQVTLRLTGSTFEGSAADVIRTVHGKGRPGRVGLVSSVEEEELGVAAGATVAVFSGAQAVLHGLGEIEFPTTVILLDRREPSYGSAVNKVLARRATSQKDFTLPIFDRMPSGIEILAFVEEP